MSTYEGTGPLSSDLVACALQAGHSKDSPEGVGGERDRDTK